VLTTSRLSLHSEENDNAAQFPLIPHDMANLAGFIAFELKAFI